MCHLQIHLVGGLGSVRLTAGLDDLKGVFQSKLLYDSMFLYIIYSAILQTGLRQLNGNRYFACFSRSISEIKCVADL